MKNLILILLCAIILASCCESCKKDRKRVISQSAFIQSEQHIFS